jgi:hypothetical protein
MDGGLRAAVLISPPLHLRTDDFLSNRWGPPQASMLRLNLFTYRELIQWIDNPMGTPPLIPNTEQLTLALA